MILGASALPTGLYSLTAHRASRLPRRRGTFCLGPTGNDPSRDIVSLAGGTRSRVPPSFHSGVAITAPSSGAFLTGLATADWPSLRCGTDALFSSKAKGLRPSWRPPESLRLLGLPRSESERGAENS